MPKLKTHKASFKRMVRLSANGKLVMRKMSVAHRARFKSKRAKQFNQIYAGGDIMIKNTGEINNITGVPNNVWLYGINPGSQTFEFWNKNDFFGVIYAPNADVEFKNSLEMYGVVIANSFTVQNNTEFNYDNALDKPAFNENCISFRITGWYEQ